VQGRVAVSILGLHTCPSPHQGLNGLHMAPPRRFMQCRILFLVSLVMACPCRQQGPDHAWMPIVGSPVKRGPPIIVSAADGGPSLGQRLNCLQVPVAGGPAERRAAMFVL
jgi:hypothetical protein